MSAIISEDAKLPFHLPLTASQPSAARTRRAWQPIFRALAMLPEYPKKKLDMQHCIMLSCRSMDEREYKKLKEEALAEYTRKLAAIETVWEMSSKDAAIVPMISIADAMREAIEKIAEPFHLWQVRQQIESDHPEMKGRVKVNTISGHLTRMHKRGELEIVRKGYGTQPSSYKKKVQAVKQ